MSIKSNNGALLGVHCVLMFISLLLDFATNTLPGRIRKLDPLDKWWLRRYTSKLIASCIDDTPGIVPQMTVNNHVYNIHARRISSNNISSNVEFDNNSLLQKYVPTFPEGDHAIAFKNAMMRSIQHIRADTDCGTFESRNQLGYKVLLVICSNMSISIYLTVQRGLLSSILSQGWENIMLDISILTYAVSLIVLLSWAVYMSLLVRCISFQFVISQMERMKLFMCYSSHTNNEYTLLEYNISMYVNKIVSNNRTDADIQLVNYVKTQLEDWRYKYKHVRHKMKECMKSMSRHSYRVAGSNLTAVLVIFINFDSVGPLSTTLSDALLTGAVALLVASSWYTLLLSGELVTYASYTYKLVQINKYLNIVGIRPMISAAIPIYSDYDGGIGRESVHNADESATVQVLTVE